MTYWLHALTTLMARSSVANIPAAAILITMARVDGSGPRAPGAKMVVTALAQFDTIGGGHLELRAVAIARQMLLEKDIVTAQRRLVRFPLGPALGQCCGGVVYLVFERVDPATMAYFGCLQTRLRHAQDSWRLIALDVALPPSLYDSNAQCLHGPGISSIPPLLNTCRIVHDTHGQRWLLDACLAVRPQLFLFGAGHVGTAIVKALSDLPCRIVWVDERGDMFPDVQSANVSIEVTDIPETMVDHAPSGASFLVMTHSHALDQSLSAHILRRNDVAWFGLIGSKTKRKQFEHRLQEHGISVQRLATMVCPIGLPGITSKEPAVIAASVSAQLLQVWERIALTAATAQDTIVNII